MFDKLQLVDLCHQFTRGELAACLRQIDKLKLIEQAEISNSNYYTFNIPGAAHVVDEGILNLIQ
jgi:hypothetical protein